MTWEKIVPASSGNIRLFRMQVPNGWLLRSVSKVVKNIFRAEIENVSLSEALVFIADPNHSWDLEQIEKWETLEFKYKDFFGALINKTFRLKVPGGWIVKTHSGNRGMSSTGTTVAEAMSFVADPEYLWTNYQKNTENKKSL